MNETIDYNGYKIRRVIVDTSVVTDEQTEGYYPECSGRPTTYLYFFPETVVKRLGNYDAVEDNPGRQMFDIYLPFTTASFRRQIV